MDIAMDYAAMDYAAMDMAHGYCNGLRRNGLRRNGLRRMDRRNGYGTIGCATVYYAMDTGCNGYAAMDDATMGAWILQWTRHDGWRMIRCNGLRCNGYCGVCLGNQVAQQ